MGASLNDAGDDECRDANADMGEGARLADRPEFKLLDNSNTLTIKLLAYEK